LARAISLEYDESARYREFVSSSVSSMSIFTPRNSSFGFRIIYFLIKESKKLEMGLEG
jgi:hypothetical protein